MILYYDINKNFSKSKDNNNDLNWLIKYYFHKSINNNKNRVIAFSFPIERNW